MKLRAGRKQRGSALVEALVAVLLFSIGVHCAAAGARRVGQGRRRRRVPRDAATIADETIGRMWVDRGNLGAYVETEAALAHLPAGTRTVTVAGNVVTVTINWQPPGEDDVRAHMVAATLASN